MDTLKPCPCGQPWPAEVSPEIRTFVDEQVEQLGEFVPIEVGARTFLVARRHIAYHGTSGAQLLSGRSGFEEITHRLVGRNC